MTAKKARTQRQRTWLWRPSRLGTSQLRHPKQLLCTFDTVMAALASMCEVSSQGMRGLRSQGRKTHASTVIRPSTTSTVCMAMDRATGAGGSELCNERNESG